MLVLFSLLFSVLAFWAIDLWSFALRRRGWLRFVGSFLLFYSQVIVTEFALGLFSWLTTLNLVLLNVVITGGLVVYMFRKFGRKVVGEYLADLKRTMKETWNDLKSDPLGLILLVLAGGLVLWVMFLGVIYPVSDFDGNSYHMTFIGNVMQYHNFWDKPTSIPWLTGYPKGGEFMEMWSVLTARSDLLTDLSQVPFAALGVYALYAIAVAVGAAKKQARFAALLFLFVPLVINQLRTSYVDVMLNTLFFSGLALLLSKSFRRMEWLLLGIIFSLMLSIKSTGVLFIAVLAPLVAWKLYGDWKAHDRRWRVALGPLVLVAIPCVFGLYWYLKDLVLYGSPIYPFGFKLLGHSIFPGKTFQEFAADAVNGSTSLPPGNLARIWYVWTEQKDWFGCLYNYDTNYAGFGPVWFVIMLPAVVTALYLAVRKRKWLFVAVSGLIGLLFLAYPSDYYTRYTVFMTGAGILALAFALTHIGRLVGNSVKMLTIGLAVVVGATNFTLCTVNPPDLGPELKHAEQGSDRGLVWPSSAFMYIQNHMKPGQTVAYDSKPWFIYPLWNASYSNKVIYIPASSETDWLRKLQQKNVNYVIAQSDDNEKKWATGSLKLVYKDGDNEVFQVR